MDCYNVTHLQSVALLKNSLLNNHLVLPSVRDCDKMFKLENHDMSSHCILFTLLGCFSDPRVSQKPFLDIANCSAAMSQLD